jgi:hypothetical protein
VRHDPGADGAKWITVRLPRTIAVLVALCVVAGACSDGGDSKSKTPAGVTGTRAGELTLHVTAADLIGPSKPMAPLADPVRGLVEKNLQKVFDATVARPLTTGNGGEIGKLFTDDAAVHANLGDRKVVFDEGQPRWNRVVPDQLEVQLTGLAGDDEQPAIVVAKLAWRVHSPNGDLRIERSGEITFTPVFGRWLVSAYDIAVNRITGASSTTTSAVKE